MYFDALIAEKENLESELEAHCEFCIWVSSQLQNAKPQDAEMLRRYLDIALKNYDSTLAKLPKLKFKFSFAIAREQEQIRKIKARENSDNV